MRQKEECSGGSDLAGAGGGGRIALLSEDRLLKVIPMQVVVGISQYPSQYRSNDLVLAYWTLDEKCIFINGGKCSGENLAEWCNFGFA